MKIRPLQDRVIVERIEEEEKTTGGIIIPDSAKEKPQEGKVVAVGRGKVNDDGKLLPLSSRLPLPPRRIVAQSELFVQFFPYRSQLRVRPLAQGSAAGGGLSGGFTAIHLDTVGDIAVTVQLFAR